jgi:hypothetical protein
MRISLLQPRRRGARLLPLLLVAVGVLGCVPRRRPELPAPQRFAREVRDVLARHRPVPAHFEVWNRLQQMGPELDAVLVALARDPEQRSTVRVNALLLLADRQSAAALPVLRSLLLVDRSASVRAAAVLALQRLEPRPEEADRLLRAAVGDPARAVRLNALQALDIGEVKTLRALLQKERDAEIRQVAMQLISVAEARGAPLVPDRRGALRTLATDVDPQIVFRPVRADSAAEVAVGDLRVELPSGRDVPLAPRAEVVAGVVPAFFSPDRSQVVVEADREIRVVDLATRRVRSLGPGIAPRVLPFTDQILFAREIAREPGPQGTGLRYQLFRASFAGGVPEMIGELLAEARPGRYANYSPLRWMVVSESPDGFVLRAEGLTTFPIPTGLWESPPVPE